MTIEKAIDQADNLRPNAFAQMQKIEWLSQLDNQVYEEVLLMARKNWKYDTKVETIDGEEVEVEDKSRIVPAFDFEPYNEQTPLDKELLIDDLYANCYVDYLVSKYDLYNKEIQNYNNSVIVFNSVYQEYQAWYRRTNEPVKKKVRRI